MDCDMRETYTFHRRVLKLLQWHCPPTLWHLKTPVHMFALDALVEAYPNAKFLWSHRDPAKVMGSVCSLIRYVRSWSSDRDDPEELGAEQLDSWAEAIRRAMDFRKRVGDDRFADVSFADLQNDPVRTLQASYVSLGLTFSDATARSVEQWAGEHKPGARGTHDYDLGRLRANARACPRTVRGLPRDLRRDRMTRPVRRRRNKLAPDPDVRRAIVAAASEALREQGVRGLSIAAVLDRAELSTRAFYRHFESKDQLVAAVFLEMAGAEERRLRRRMAKAADPVEAVATWIDGRLDLAFDENIKSDLRRLSLEAQSQMFAAPELIQPAYAEMLKPLIEQLHRGLILRVFHDIDPVTEAQSIQGVVWASTERQWAAGDCRRAEVRQRALRFCLRGLGVAPETIADIAARD